jgi:hypothetical protein
MNSSRLSISDLGFRGTGVMDVMKIISVLCQLPKDPAMISVLLLLVSPLNDFQFLH